MSFIYRQSTSFLFLMALFCSMGIPVFSEDPKGNPDPPPCCPEGAEKRATFSKTVDDPKTGPITTEYGIMNRDLKIYLGLTGSNDVTGDEIKCIRWQPSTCEDPLMRFRQVGVSDTDVCVKDGEKVSTYGVDIGRTWSGAPGCEKNNGNVFHFSPDVSPGSIETFTITASAWDTGDCNVSDGDPVQVSVTVQVWRPRNTLESLAYQAYIPCSYVDGVPATNNFFGADGRTAPALGGSSRSSQTVSARIANPPYSGGSNVIINGLTGPSPTGVYPSVIYSAGSQFFGLTNRYWFDHNPATDCGVAGTSDCVTPAAGGPGVPGCTETEDADHLDIWVVRAGQDYIRVVFEGNGNDPCIFPAPDLDVHMYVELRARCDSDSIIYEYRINGSHDRYPSHEIFLNGTNIYHFDACALGTGAASLLHLASITPTGWIQF